MYGELLLLGRVDEAMVELNTLRPRLTRDEDAVSYVSEALHAGGQIEVALEWLTAVLETALADQRFLLTPADRGHDPGRVAVDLAVMLADGGEVIADLAVLRNQGDVFGPVATDATACRDPPMGRPRSEPARQVVRVNAGRWRGSSRPACRARCWSNRRPR